MVAEVTIIGLDDTLAMVAEPYMFELEKQAIKLYCRAKSQSNPENTFGVASLHSPLTMLLDTTSDIDEVLKCVRGVFLSGTLNFQHGIGFAQVGFLKRSPNGMRKRMLLFVGGPLIACKADMEELGRFLKDKDIAVDVVWFHDTLPIRNKVKKEMLEAFVAAVNNNHHPSHIAYLEDGCDLCRVLTESGILTHVKKDVSGLAPGLLMEEERATHKNKAAVINSPENVIPYGMRMKNHPPTSTRGLASALADLSMEDKIARIKASLTRNFIPNNNNNINNNNASNSNKKKKKNKKMSKLLDNSEPEKTPFKTSKNDNISRKGKNQVAK